MKKQHADIYCNLDFWEIFTRTYCFLWSKDPAGEDFYFDLNSPNSRIGNALVAALKKSEDISLTKETKAVEERLQARTDKIVAELEKNTSPDDFLKMVYKCHRISCNWMYDENGRSIIELVRGIDNPKIEDILKKYNYKNKTAMFSSMQSCTAETDGDIITLSPSKHGNSDSWEGMPSSYDIIIPSSSAPEVIGAGVKYAIASCTGKGADQVAGKLFPDGVPDTFDDYLESLNLSLN
ncbi:MAG: CdiI family contact-dependent growth inhibition immunity protein [Holosporaceae bacterium]|jgi:galactitol-specific phosphotransferase system IIB component|nr:CdiI family contact-dependent growth inhibition immunity protein [Holosporaceae bacterium]